MTNSTKARLTPHQTDTLARLVKWHMRTTKPVPLADFGSSGAVSHLSDKGYVTLTSTQGARGGTHWYAEPVYANVPSKLAREAARATWSDPTNGEETTCGSCGELIYLAIDGWLHSETNGPRCWPGRDFFATPEAV